MLAATLLADQKLPCPLLVDSMTNEASISYGALPEKLVIIDAYGKIAYMGGQGAAGYKIEEMRGWIEKYLKDTKSKKNS